MKEEHKIEIKSVLTSMGLLVVIIFFKNGIKILLNYDAGSAFLGAFFMLAVVPYFRNYFKSKSEKK